MRTFFSQIAGKSISTQVQPADMDFLTTNGYVSLMQKQEYDQASAEVATLAQKSQELQAEEIQETSAAAALAAEEKKTHSFLFQFEGSEKRNAELTALESARDAVSKEQGDIVGKDSAIRQLIQKKSTIDRMVPYDGGYLALTGLGVTTLNDLNVRNYRVSDTEFSDFITEKRETLSELRLIAENASSDVSRFKTWIPEVDPSQLWSVSIGLAKLQGDPNMLAQRFFDAYMVLEDFGSTFENKMMAAEIMTSLRPGQSLADNSDLQNLAASLRSLDHDLRHRAHVPKELSAGVAATIMFGRKFDGSFPTDRFIGFSSITRSFESAAILAVINYPMDQLTHKFRAFRQMFNLWGYQTSEDTELASAYLAISDFEPDDVRTKLQIILSGLKNYLEYPLVATAILTTIPTIEANETLDLMERTYSILWSFAQTLERSELVSLSVRMIHGIKNELVQKLDPTAKIANTPVQFTHPPYFIFFPYRAPLIIAHSAYYSTFSGIGGAHPAHVHGFGGGGFGG